MDGQKCDSIAKSHIDYVACEHSFYVGINIARCYDAWLIIRNVVVHVQFRLLFL